MITQLILSILQYNVRNNKNDVMISLLIDSKIKKYDILTIQKSWRNVYVLTSYNLFTIDFHLTYDQENNVRVCFYINVKLNVNCWSIDFVFFYVYIIKLKIATNKMQRNIHIHNVYNAFSISYAFLELFIIFTIIERLLQDDANHILLSDFNLHHSLWSRSTRLIQHVVVDQLIDLINAKYIQLCLSQNIITWKTRNSFNIINLVFATNKLQVNVTHYESRRDFNQFSNHIFTFTILMIKIKRILNKKRHVWKLFNYDKLATHMRLLVCVFVFINHKNIEFLTRELQDCINSVIHAIVFLFKNSSRTKSYWNQKCVDVVTTTKRCRRE
jgi:hypothetical protein